MAPTITIHPHRPARNVQQIHLNVQTSIISSQISLSILFLGQRFSNAVSSFSATYIVFLSYSFLLNILLLFLASARKRRKGNGSGSCNQEPQPKNAVAILNELKKNLVYELESQEGPYHAPIFTMSVMVSISQLRHRLPNTYLSLFLLRVYLGRWSEICWSGKVKEAGTH